MPVNCDLPEATTKVQIFVVRIKVLTKMFTATSVNLLTNLKTFYKDFLCLSCRPFISEDCDTTRIEFRIPKGSRIFVCYRCHVDRKKFRQASLGIDLDYRLDLFGSVALSYYILI